MYIPSPLLKRSTPYQSPKDGLAGTCLFNRKYREMMGSLGLLGLLGPSGGSLPTGPVSLSHYAR